MARNPKGWHHEDIKAAVRKTGITLKALSLQSGLSESATRIAILFRVCPAGEKAIYEHLGVNPYIIWPDRYNKHGQRIIGHAAKKSTKNKAPGHCQNGETA